MGRGVARGVTAPRSYPSPGGLGRRPPPQGGRWSKRRGRALIARGHARCVDDIPRTGALTFPTLTGRVVDEANILDPATQRAALTQKLADLEAKSTDQVVVVTLKSLQGTSIEDYGYQLGRHWQIGQKDKNNGVLLIVAPNERKVRIEVGYGLEGTLTDLVSQFHHRELDPAAVPRQRLSRRDQPRRRRHHPGAHRRRRGMEAARRHSVRMQMPDWVCDPADHLRHLHLLPGVLDDGRRLVARTARQPPPRQPVDRHPERIGFVMVVRLRRRLVGRRRVPGAGGGGSFGGGGSSGSW